MVELTGLDARCYVCGHLISGPTTIYTDKGQAHPSCVNCSPYAEDRIAELEAENERLRRLVMAQSRAIHSPEALSRTGAVKAGLERAAEIVLAQIDSKPDWTPEQEKELRGHDPVATARSAARVAIRQCHRAILSALEPAAPEGQQQCATEGCDNPATNEFIRGDTGSHYCGDCFVKVIEVCETRTRPTEQAVTEVGIEAAWAVISLHHPDQGSFDEDRSTTRAALKAAMEAGG